MIKFICLFLPAILAISKDEFRESKIYIVKKYVLYNLLINTIILCILDVKNKFIPLSLEDAERFNVHFSVQYLVLAIILSFTLPKILKIAKNNIHITFKGKKKWKYYWIYLNIYVSL